MISEQNLKEICESYNINFENLIKTNPNILNLGNYEDICQVLDYIRVKLGITPSNIEKCPSILYRNVFNIESNHNFLKEKNIYIDSDISKFAFTLKLVDADFDSESTSLLFNTGATVSNQLILKFSEYESWTKIPFSIPMYIKAKVYK